MPDASAAARTAARLFVASTIGHLNQGPLAGALKDAYGDAYATGLLVGAQQAGKVDPVDWSTWTPGQAAAAGLLDNGGLANLLDEADLTIKGITGSALDRMGTLLADGIAQGLGVDEIAASMGEVLNDSARADMIARTETARAVETASQEQYRSAGVLEADWLDSPDSCPLCMDLAAGGPYPLDRFPDMPAHPDCRCSSSPRDPGASD